MGVPFVGMAVTDTAENSDNVIANNIAGREFVSNGNFRNTRTQCLYY